MACVGDRGAAVHGRALNGERETHYPPGAGGAAYHRLVATILVADDIAGQRMILDMLLSVDGYDVELVEDGLEALQYLKEHTPDLAVLDVMMPNVSGIEVCMRMKRITRLRKIPVVMLTGLRDDETRAQINAAQADALVYKPLEGKDFRETIRTLLSQRSADTVQLD